jgi:sortase A
MAFMSARYQSIFTLRLFNDFLGGVIVILASYIFLLPFVPQVDWQVHKHPHPTLAAAQAESKQIPVAQQDKRLLVPALGLNEPIYEGTSVYTVNKGIWIRPNASTPDSGGNSVLVGHRFTYTNPRGVFYYLDKLKTGDIMTVYWDHKAYYYQVKTMRVVEPSDTSVEGPSSDKRLTLYTCTPLWSLKNRLVVVAISVEAS